MDGQEHLSATLYEQLAREFDPWQLSPPLRQGQMADVEDDYAEGLSCLCLREQAQM